MVGIVVGVGLLMAALFGKMPLSFLSKQKLDEKKVHDEEAEAIVLKVEQTGLYFGNKPQVRLQVQVQPERGRNYITEMIFVTSSATIITGTRIRVRFNAGNPQKIRPVIAA